MSQPDPVKQSYDRLVPVYDPRWRSYEDATCGTGELERLLLARCPGL
jgi:hypothetical protein